MRICLVVMLGLLACGSGDTKSKESSKESSRENLDDLRDEAEAAAKRATDALAKVQKTRDRVDADIAEVKKLVAVALVEIESSKTEAERAAAQARLGVFRDKLRQLEDKRDRIRDELDELTGGSSEVHRTIAKMDEFSKKMCDCKDKACADRVNDEMTKWGTEMAKRAGASRDEKPDPEAAKKAADIMTRYTECMTKMMMAGMGATGAEASDPLSTP